MNLVRRAVGAVNQLKADGDFYGKRYRPQGKKDGPQKRRKNIQGHWVYEGFFIVPPQNWV
jgi:hypothetical protein